MLAGRYNIVCEQGATFRREFTLQYPDELDPTIYYNYDLSNYKARMQVRRTVDSSDPMLSIDSEELGGIVIDGENGKLYVEITAEQTSDITTNGVYDIEIEDETGVVSRMVQGEFLLSPEVTR